LKLQYNETVSNIAFIFNLRRYSKALAEYDEFCALTKRRYVMPNFAEVRHIINIAQAGPGPRPHSCLLHRGVDFLYEALTH
jgi:hypothetical protein